MLGLRAMTERLEIDALRALLAISTHGGVTRAAEHLALSQSAVSHRISRLENSLDCKLLTRRSGAQGFTEAGLKLLDYAERMIDLHDEALAAVSKKSLSGTVRLGMTEDTTISGIARILGRFTRLYPQIRVSTRTGQSLNVQSWLKAGDIDIAIMQVFDADLRPDDTVLFDDCLYWVKSRDFTLDPSKSVPFLSFDTNCFYKEWAYQEGQSWGHRFHKVLECPSAAGIQSAVRSGLGVAVLNGMHVTSDIEIVEGIFPAPPGITYIARTRSPKLDDASLALIREIAREIQGENPLRAVG